MFKEEQRRPFFIVISFLDSCAGIQPREINKGEWILCDRHQCYHTWAVRGGWLGSSSTVWVCQEVELS